jgi:hypothetical protein
VPRSRIASSWKSAPSSHRTRLNGGVESTSTFGSAADCVEAGLAAAESDEAALAPKDGPGTWIVYPFYT